MQLFCGSEFSSACLLFGCRNAVANCANQPATAATEEKERKFNKFAINNKGYTDRKETAFVLDSDSDILLILR